MKLIAARSRRTSDATARALHLHDDLLSALECGGVHLGDRGRCDRDRVERAEDT